MQKLIEEVMQKKNLATAGANSARSDIEKLREKIEELKKCIKNNEAKAAMYETVIDKLKELQGS